MSVARLMIVVLSTAGLAAANGDRAHPPGRIPMGFAAVAPRSARAGDSFLTSFRVCGWVGPPAESTTAGRVAEMKAAGLDLMLPAFEDSGRPADNRARLKLARAEGLRCIVWDRRFDRLDPASASGQARLDSIVADYRDDPAFFGYYLGDEPPVNSFPRLAVLYAALRARDPAHTAWNNLSGRPGFETRDQQAHQHREFLSLTGARVLSNDCYDFVANRDRGQFVENAALSASIAREYGAPFWSFIQLIDHGPFRAPTRGELAWQVSMLLAYGARGIGYFTWWAPRPSPTFHWGTSVIDTAGRRTHWYETVKDLDVPVRAAGSTLADLVWIATVHAGSVPQGGTRFVPDDWVSAVRGRAALGYFADPAGTRYLLVANSDSASAQTISLALVDARRACVLSAAAPSWSAAPCLDVGIGASLVLDLPPGGFALARLEGGTAGGVAGGIAPTLALTPNPARGLVRLAVESRGDGARLEILDAGGRRAWSRSFPAGPAVATWHGEREGGGIAGPGVYFVRVEDAHGFRVRRLAWLGSR